MGNFASQISALDLKYEKGPQMYSAFASGSFNISPSRVVNLALVHIKSCASIMRNRNKGEINQGKHS